MQDFERFDIAIVGGGILGVSIARWLSELYDCKICIIEGESKLACHTSSRNTGVIHRPFYLNPETKKVFARCAERSLKMWHELAVKYDLPWNPAGTIEVALTEDDLDTLQKYKKWANENGMQDDETEILNSAQVSLLEPEVKCKGAIHSKTDTCVNYGEFTRKLGALAVINGLKILLGSRVAAVSETGKGVEITLESKRRILCSFLINAAGGGALYIAHRMGLAKDYSILCFRGEYWVLDEPFASKISRNVYTVARHKEFPFLDPHFIVRASGKREIGPNAVLVSGPRTYRGLGIPRLLGNLLFESPRIPKWSLLTSSEFLSLAWGEWKSSFSKKAMCGRLKAFIPNLEPGMMSQRGISGIRSSLIDRRGFVPEALEIYGDRSLHILNYNSPGASGAPSFSAYLISRLAERGFLDEFRKSSNTTGRLWDYENASVLDK